MEYAVAVLRCRLIVVMGHTSCGAVAAAVKHSQDSEALPGELCELIEQIVLPSVAGCGTGLEGVMEEAVACNAKEGVEKILRMSEVLSEAVVAGELKIVAGVYDIESGEFSLLTGGM